jgi:hypothetical protein
MLRQKLLPAMLAILPATGALTSQTTDVYAATEPCATRPGSAAPARSHWYYRINRGDNHRCWYLSSLEARSVRRGASVVRRNFTSRRTRPTQHASESEIDARTPSRMEPTKAALALEQAMVEAFAARWPDLPEYEPLDVHTVATRSYIEDPGVHADQISLVSVVDGKRARQQQQTSAVFEPVILAGALMTGLLVAGGVFRLTRRHRRTYSRNQRCSSANQLDRRADELARFTEPNGNGLTPETRGDRPVWHASTPTDPAEDFARSLRQLTRGLQLVLAGRVSRRSFSARTRTAMVTLATQPTVGAASAKRLA